MSDPVWRYEKSWRCVAHDKMICNPCNKLAKRPVRGKSGDVFPDAATAEAAPDTQRAAPRGRQKISEAGAHTESGQLVCPKCGGAQFKAKRSKKGKVIGITTLGVGGVIAPKSQVKCETCGTMFKRG